MKVKDYKIFCLFSYKSCKGKTLFNLGDIVFKKGNPKYDEKDEIGIIIQKQSFSEFRTDMFGNCCAEEIRPATIKEIKKLRRDILPHIVK